MIQINCAIELIDNCESVYFWNLIKKVEGIDAVVIETLDGLDDLYVDVLFEDTTITFSYNIYLGIHIYPKAGDQASEQDQRKLRLLNDKINTLL